MILALDIGSSSVRAALYDENANEIPRTSIKIERSLKVAANGAAEIDADEFVTQVEAAIDALLSKTSRDIEYVASCSFWHSLVGIDDRGKTTTKILTWADRRSWEYSAVLKDRFDEREVHNRTGAHFHSSFWPAKLLWLRNGSRAIFDGTSRWLSPGDLITERFCGEAVTSVSMASGTGIFDQRKCDWDPELLRSLKITRTRLARIAADGETFRLTRKYAKRWPRLANAEWFPTIADGAADNIGSGCMTRRDAALMVGTSAAMRVVYDGDPPRRIPQGLWCYRVDRRRIVIGGALSDGGNLYALIKDRFKLPRNTDELIKEREPAEGLVVVPFFHGERSTGYDEYAAGAIIGLTAVHDGIDVLRAAMEGVAFRLDDIFVRLRKVVKIERIVASGGALRESPVWTQIIADTLGREVNISGVKEASMLGTVLLAMESVGKMESIENL